MANFLLIYHGGSTSENASPGEQQAVMQSWIDWFSGLGAAVVDGGNPVSRNWTLSSNGTTEDGGANPATGYSVLSAPSMQDALALAAGCPHLKAGGTVEICETFNVG